MPRDAENRQAGSRRWALGVRTILLDLLFRQGVPQAAARRAGASLPGVCSGSAGGAWGRFIYVLGVAMAFLLVSRSSGDAGVRSRVSGLERRPAALITRSGGAMLVAAGVPQVSGGMDSGDEVAAGALGLRLRAVAVAVAALPVPAR